MFQAENDMEKKKKAWVKLLGDSSLKERKIHNRRDGVNMSSIHSVFQQRVCSFPLLEEG